MKWKKSQNQWQVCRLHFWLFLCSFLRENCFLRLNNKSVEARTKKIVILWQFFFLLLFVLFCACCRFESYRPFTKCSSNGHTRRALSPDFIYSFSNDSNRAKHTRRRAEAHTHPYTHTRARSKREREKVKR